MRNLLLLSTILVFLVSCKDDNTCEQQPDVSDINLDVAIERLDKELFALNSKEEIQAFLDKYPTFTEHFIFGREYPHDSMLVSQLFKLTSDPYVDTLYNETQKVFDDLEFIEAEFESAFKHIKYYYPEFNPPAIQTAITGFGNDLYVSDSLIIIGLEYFLGEKAKYQAPDIPQYILKRYSKETIVPSVVLLLSDQFNKTNLSDKTMLAEMLHYGKAYYFTKRMIPCLQDSLLMGYSEEEIHEAKQNEGIIWAHFIENELLYETNHFQKQKYLSERPKTLDIGSKCPGRIGTWVGYEMIKKFNQNSKVELQGLMEEVDVQKILRQSKYRPKNS